MTGNRTATDDRRTDANRTDDRTTAETTDTDADAAPDERRPAGDETAGPDEGDRAAGDGDWTRRQTRRWRGIVAVALGIGAVGVLSTQPAVLLAAAVGVAYAAYPRLVAPPDVDVAIERSLSETTPAPGDPVEVTVTVRNEGDRTLPDLRVVDGVAPMLRVTDGRARRAATLRPGSSVTFSYTVRASAGQHAFEPATVVARDVSGATELVGRVPAEGDDAIACSDWGASPPLRRQTTPEPGRVLADEGDAGIEFSSVREYRPGDPVERIDWRRFARNGGLTTVQFREERNVSVALVVDTRPAARRGSDDRPHGAARSIAAADELLSAIDGPERVGLATIGPDRTWVPPSSGRDHVEALRRRLRSHDCLADAVGSASGRAGAGAGADRAGGRDADRSAVAGRVDRLLGGDDPDTAGDRGDAVSWLTSRLGPDTQIVLLSPLLDDGASRLALALDQSGHAVSVVSPDVVGEETPGERLVGVERANRIDSLRRAEVPVVDWSGDQRLGAAVTATRERWSP